MSRRKWLSSDTNEDFSVSSSCIGCRLRGPWDEYGGLLSFGQGKPSGLLPKLRKIDLFQIIGDNIIEGHVDIAIACNPICIPVHI